MSSEILAEIASIPIATAELIDVGKGPKSTFNETGAINETQLARLIDQGFTSGLAKSFKATKDAFANRIWIVDNSGSMQDTDGHRIVETGNRNRIKIIPCSRWDELRECINYHIQLSTAINAPTTFRILNDNGTYLGPQRFEVAKNPSSSTFDAQEALNVMKRVRPGGCTPLTKHFLDIYSEVSAMAPQLMRNGQRIAVILATDGLPTDERGYGGCWQQNEFVEALRRFEGLPIWLVIRLCTDDETVVNFYNELDSLLEVSVDILDDFCGEYQEVYEKNSWLNYALPLHRMREMGYHDRVFDLLDERTLTKGELRDFCFLLFGEENFDGVPDPSLNWPGFVRSIKNLLRKEEEQWDPIKKRMRPWIDVPVLNRTYGEKSCTIM